MWRNGREVLYLKFWKVTAFLDSPITAVTDTFESLLEDLELSCFIMAGDFMSLAINAVLDKTILFSNLFETNLGIEIWWWWWWLKAIDVYPNRELKTFAKQHLIMFKRTDIDIRRCLARCNEHLSEVGDVVMTESSANMQILAKVSRCHISARYWAIIDVPGNLLCLFPSIIAHMVWLYHMRVL